jgi:hypothetical protein
MIKVTMFLMIAFFNQVFAANLPDDRYASARCQLDADLTKIVCDYRYSPALDVKDMKINVSGQPVGLEQKNISNFSTTGAKLVTLILLDISDPARNETVDKKYKDIVNKILDKKTEYQEIGIATFDTEFRIVAPIGSSKEDLKKALAEVKASGMATEFYKNILASVELLKKTQGDRKGLVIFSDGKDEDKAYKREDVVSAAASSGITFLGVGFAERDADLPYLQNIEWLAHKTYGSYLNYVDISKNSNFLNHPLGGFEKGGRITFSPPSKIYSRELVIELTTNDSQKVDIKSKINMPSDEGFFKKLLGFLVVYWALISICVLVFIISLFAAIKLIRKKKFNSIFAELEEFAGSQSRHALKKVATRIGRGKDNDIVFLNDSISSNHAEIHRRREGGVFIVDLSSTNGVYVNDQKVSQFELSDGDLIEIGDVKLKFKALF